MNHQLGSPVSVARRALAASLLGSAAVLAAACSSSSTSSTAAASPSVTATATPSPSASTSAPAATPTTSAPTAELTQCSTSALRVSAGTSQGAAGTIYTNIDFKNVSSSSCVLQGYPGVSLVSAGSNAGSQIGADAKRESTTPIRPITLAPGQTAHAMLGVAEAGNFPTSSCNPVMAHWLKVFPPDQFSAAYAPFTTQTCASTSEPTMRITAISAGS